METSIAEFFFFFQIASTQQNVFLKYSLVEESPVQPGDNITFGCKTVGSPILAWTGIDYVNGRIEFLVVDQIGTMYTPNAYTTAVLVNASTDGNGQYIIESFLNITVQSSILRSTTITCHNVGTEETQALSFQSSNTPVLTCGDPIVCPGQFRSFHCEIRDSIILAWENDEYIGPQGNRMEFLSTEPVGTVKISKVNPGVFANLTENFIQNGVQVLKCELNISEFSYHPEDISMRCVNVGLDTKDTYRVQIRDDCDSTTTTISDNSPTDAVTKVSVGTMMHSTSDAGEVEMLMGGGTVLISVVACVVILVLCAIIGVLIIVAIYCYKRMGTYV